VPRLEHRPQFDQIPAVYAKFIEWYGGIRLRQFQDGKYLFLVHFTLPVSLMLSEASTIADIFNGFPRLPFLDCSSWEACDNRGGRDVRLHNRTRADDCPVPDPDARPDERARGDPAL
jgi:hypothetical protein